MVVPARRRLHSGQRVRTIVVDDSALFRHLVVRTLEQDPAIQVVATAPNGAVALDRIAKHQPDVVSLDIEMPEMDGLETLRRIRRDFPDTRVVMFSSYTERGASATFTALSLGADDYVAKTGNEESAGINLRDLLIPKIKQFFSFGDDPEFRFAGAEQRAALLIPSSEGPRDSNAAVKLIAIGVSTGGPEALSSVIGQFPANFDVPIMIVQHMPPLFTRLLCERLQEKTELAVREAGHRDGISAGSILVAPGDFHMRVGGTISKPFIQLDQGPMECSCRPSVDALFASAAELYGSAVLAVVLTGMGQDGLRGAGLLKERGSSVFVQDEATSAVWGMPRAVATAGLADAILPLPVVVPEILSFVNRSRRVGANLPQSGNV